MFPDCKTYNEATVIQEYGNGIRYTDISTELRFQK